MWILQSDEVRDWIQCPASALLVMELPPTPGLLSAVTYASAILIRSILRVGTCPVLYQFSALRESDPDEHNAAGDSGLMVSLITQLLPYVLEEAGTSLDFLAGERFEKASRDPPRLFLILKRLLKSLPRNRCVYIVLDSVAALRNGAKAEEEGVLGKVLGLVAEEDLYVKILMGGPTSDNVVRSMKARVEPESRVSCLYVPERVGGGCQGRKTAWVEQQTEDLVRGP